MIDQPSATEVKGTPVRPLAARLKHLVTTSRRSLWRGAMVSGLPLAGMIGGIASFTLIDTIEMSSWFRTHFGNAGNTAMMLGYAVFYVPLFLLALGVGIGAMYLVLENKFTSSYRIARGILQHTDVPALIADGKVIEILAASSVPVTEANLPDTVEARSNAEEQIKLAAAYLHPLHAFTRLGDRGQAGKSFKPRGFLSPIKLTGYKVGSVASGCVLGCPLNFGLSCLLGPPAVAFATLHGLPYAEYLGNLKAISEHMLGEMSDSCNYKGMRLGQWVVGAACITSNIGFKAIYIIVNTGSIWRCNISILAVQYRQFSMQTIVSCFV